ncbi:MAG: hypothetical protein IKN59_06895 [Paludibacteraceae bacterium]|nr:hypothetical protein [Paludibacteraceae bacterium]
MKKQLIITLLALMVSMGVSAKKPYNVTVLGEYGYNTTWLHFGGAEVRANLPFNDYFELDVAGESLSSNVHTFSVTARPTFDLPVGQLFIDGTVFYSGILRNRVADFAMAASLGYRMDYVSVQLGTFCHVMGDLDYDYHSLSTYSVDPFNVLYRLQVNTRPYKSPWNIYLGAADYTELEYERHWQPIFFLGAHYDLPFYNIFRKSDNLKGNTRNIRLLAEVYCKPTGMFHLAASFYGIKAKVGMSLRF